MNSTKINLMKITFFGFIVALGVVLGVVLTRHVSPAASPVTTNVSGPAGIASFLTFGDWGSNTPKQKAVAETTAAYAAKEGNIQAVILCGDNFYMKLPGGVNDIAWKQTFEDMYDIKRLSMPFYAVLGNHDYDGQKNVTELTYEAAHPGTRWHMPARWYRVNIPAEKPLVSLFMLESTMEKFNKEDWATQKDWLDKELANTAPGVWKICVAHHTIVSNGSHGGNGKLDIEWGPIFKKHSVDFYLCGHDHDMQHLEVPGQTISYVLVGGGGAGLRPMRKDSPGPFSKSSNGFGHFQVTADKVIVRFIDETGKEMHSFEKHRDGSVKDIVTMPSDKPTTQQLKALEGIGTKKGDD